MFLNIPRLQLESRLSSQWNSSEKLLFYCFCAKGSNFAFFFIKMGIFEEIKAIFAYSGLGTSHFVQIHGRNVPRSLIRFLVLSFSTLICVLEGVLCTRLLNYNLVDCLTSFVCMLGFYPAVTIYISLIMKANVINQLFEYLENIISTSKPN